METKRRGINTTQKQIFELKKKVITSLNKLADRDTYQRGLNELNRTAETLPHDMFSSFLSCILDTDPDQKTAVRKESIRLIATLANSHDVRLVGMYLNKMVSSIVKRLKDPDSVVRDACIETIGVLASKMSYCDVGIDTFISLAKPLFEAVGDQNNKCVQAGAALCLAKVVDNSPDAPVPIIQRMMIRTVKLVDNASFAAKPAVIELNKSIILAGGAAMAKSVLVSAVTSFRNALKSNDWTTRKAASIALMDIAATGEKFLGDFKASCISSLESCRFDKVKPVRDSVVHALQYWKGVVGSDGPEPSETAESYNGGQESSELFNTGASSNKSNKHVTDFARRNVPFSARKAPNDETRKTRKDHWDIEIAVPESEEGSCITKTLNTPQVTYEYIPEEDDIKSVTVSSNSFRASGSTKMNPTIVVEEEEEETDSKDRTSLDSVLTMSSSQTNNHDYYARLANEMASVYKKLADIETKQSLLIDHIQAFSAGIMNNFSILQSKVVSLEHAVEEIAQITNSNSVKRSTNSTLSPRLSSSYSITRENKTRGKSRLNASHGIEKPRSNPTSEDIWNNFGQGRQGGLNQNRESSDSSRSIRQYCREAMSGTRKGMVESEYLEATGFECFKS